jgi:hypothetical protein
LALPRSGPPSRWRTQNDSLMRPVLHFSPPRQIMQGMLPSEAGRISQGSSLCAYPGPGTDPPFAENRHDGRLPRQEMGHAVKTAEIHSFRQFLQANYGTPAFHICYTVIRSCPRQDRKLSVIQGGEVP